jgi:hypothetical protein
MATCDPNTSTNRFWCYAGFEMPDALLFDSILDSAVIECFLLDEHTIRMD